MLYLLDMTDPPDLLGVHSDRVQSDSNDCKHRDSFCGSLTLDRPSTNRESNPKDHLVSAGPLLSSTLGSVGASGGI